MKEKSRRRPGRLARPGASDEVARLRELLAEAEATLRAIRTGDVDAVVVEGASGLQVYTLEGAHFDYRALIESMNEGALVLNRSAVILYANAHFALMVERPLSELLGHSLCELLSSADQAALKRLLKRRDRPDAATELQLQRQVGQPMPARVAIRTLAHVDSADGIGMVVTDIREFRTREELLRSFSQRLMHMLEVERVEMARRLGDNLTQVLCSVLMRCQSLTDRIPAKNRGLRKEAHAFAGLLRTTAKEVHLIAADLQPHGLEVLGLASAVRGVTAEFAERMGVPIKVSCTRMCARLPAGAELTLYRILQQGLRNVEQHAQARQVSVTLRARGPTFRLIIKDDGIGFDTAKLEAATIQEGWFGLLSMRERAIAMGGSLDVISAPAAGTQVCLSVPLSRMVLPEERDGGEAGAPPAVPSLRESSAQGEVRSSARAL